MGQARLREALNAGGPGTQKEKGPPVADGVLTVTPDTPEALEWKSRRSAIDSAGTSSSYLEDEEEPQPNGLYGKFTWKIENFSEISKRELRSTVFEVGNYKWYILVYPQGCDVCNHLSLFLCVADYDKLLPGWSHFAQFTIAVVNKDPKKSKYSDTLHRFCKKEHDWGWKKFMELSKVLEGFTVANTLVIKAQVQVIRDRPSLPFRCLDPQYRRELVRVYLTNVEGICRRFVDEKRESLLRIKETAASFKAYWGSQSPNDKKALLQHKGSDMLKGLVKQFFNEKEVTSTLVMDALFSGCKQVEEASRAGSGPKGKRRVTSPSVVINADKNVYALGHDVLAVLDRACQESIPMLGDDKPGDALTVRHGPETDDYNRDFIERDEKRLADLGRRTVEMYVIAHIIADLEEHHVKFEKYKMQDALIQEEEEGQRLDKNKAAAKAAADREKKQRKKEKRQARVEAESARREAEEAERSRAEELKQREAERMQSQQATERRRVQTALEEAQAEAMHKAAACTSGGATQLTVGKAIEASKEAAAQLAAKGLSHQLSSDSGEGPSSSTSCAPKESPEAGAGAAGASGQAEDTLGSASSSLTDLPADEECSGTSRRPAADSEEDGFSYNEDDTESQEEVIQSLHLHIDSLKQQVGSLLDEADARQQMMQAIQQRVETRDKRIQALLQQLADCQGQLADATSALEARNVLLKEREQELAEKEAELATFTSGRQPQQQQQQLPAKLQSVGSVASTIHSTAGLPFEECSVRSSASSDSHPLSPTSSMDGPTDSLRPRASLNHQPRTHSHQPTPSAHTLPRDSSSSTSHSHRVDALNDTSRGRASSQGGVSHANDDRGSDRGSERGSDRGGLKGVGPSSSGVDPSLGSSISRNGGSRGGAQMQQPGVPTCSAASSKADQVAAATAAAAAALRPSSRGNGRNQSAPSSSVTASQPAASASGKAAPGGHLQHAPSPSHAAASGHQAGPGPHSIIPNGVTSKPSKQQQQQQQHQSKQPNARMLNGNAAAFVPASVSGALPSISSSISLASTSSGTLNSHSNHANHTSYRNAAAGVTMSSSTALPSTSAMLPLPDRGASSQGSLSPRQSASSLLHAPDGPAANSPGSNISKGMQNGDVPYPVPKIKQSSPAPFISPDAPKAQGQGGAGSSTGLEDFAHMGLIDDLLA